MRQLVVAAVGWVALTLAALPVSAQEEEKTHVITVTTFEIPRGKDLEDFWTVVDKYVMPSDKENPHVLSERLASHYWGDDKLTVWFISEYEDLAAIEAAEKWTNADFDKNYPEGSAQRDSADTAFQEKFLRHFSGHADNILLVDTKRMK